MVSIQSSLLLTYFFFCGEAAKLVDRRVRQAKLQAHGQTQLRGRTQPANVGRSSVVLNSQEEAVLKRMQWWQPGKEPLPDTGKYLLFTMDPSGLNNIRIGWEMTALVAQYTGRTLVLPPARSVYLLDWGRRVTGFLPKELENGQTQTSMEDMINVPQLKATLPTLTYQEFLDKTGTTWDDAVKQSKELEGENFADCMQVKDYKNVDAKFLFMPGDTGDRREGFNCGQWYRNGGPKDALREEVGEAGFAMLTHGFSWHEDAFRVAAKAVNYLGLFNYTSMHARYNDFEKNFGKQAKPQEALDSLEPWLKEGSKLYVATDEPAKFDNVNTHGAKLVMWKDLLDTKTNSLLETEKTNFGDERWFKMTGPIEELICTYSKVFVGSDKSSFSGHIDAMRIQAEAPTTTRVMHTDTFPVQDVKDNIAAWDKKGEFTPLPRNKGNVFFLQLGMQED